MRTGGGGAKNGANQKTGDGAKVSCSPREEFGNRLKFFPSTNRPPEKGPFKSTTFIPAFCQAIMKNGVVYSFGVQINCSASPKHIPSGRALWLLRPGCGEVDL